MANAIILGTSSGIGKEMALRLAGEKWRIGITGRRENLLDEIATVFPDSIIPAALDVDDVAALGGRGVASQRCGFVDHPQRKEITVYLAKMGDNRAYSAVPGIIQIGGAMHTLLQDGNRKVEESGLGFTGISPKLGNRCRRNCCFASRRHGA